MKKSLSTSTVAAVAAGAAASVVSNAALAADAMVVAEPEWYLSLEGGAIFADPATDKFGVSGSGFSNVNDFDTDFGYRGAAAIGRKFDDNLDWRLGVAYSDFLKNHASLSFSGGSGSGSVDINGGTDLSYLTGDLELGYNVRPSDRFDLRLFAGLRALNSNDSQDKFGDISGGPFSGGTIAFDGKVDTEFLGIGPRVGVDFSSRLGEGPLGFSGMLATSVLFGELKQKMSFTASSGGSSIGSSFSEDKNETVFNLEAAFGADFHIADSSVLTIGYRGEYWDSIRGGGTDKMGSGGDDMLSHGPFVRFIANF